MRPKGKLTARQKRFVAEYLIDLNATQAYIRSGYKGPNADAQGPRMLSYPSVQRELVRAMKRREERTEISQDRVLQELSRICFFDIRKLFNPDGSLKRPDQLDETAAAVLASIDVVEMSGGMQVDGDGVKHIPMFTKKAKVFDKNGALTLAMRHLGMLKDGLKLTGPGDGPIQHVTMTQDEFRDIARDIADQV